jgi:hypothetical protein
MFHTYLDEIIYPKDKSGLLQKVHFSTIPNSFMNFPLPLHCKHSKLIYINEDSNKVSVKKVTF